MFYRGGGWDTLVISLELLNSRIGCILKEKDSSFGGLVAK